MFLLAVGTVQAQTFGDSSTLSDKATSSLPDASSSDEAAKSVDPFTLMLSSSTTRSSQSDALTSSGKTSTSEDEEENDDDFFMPVNGHFTYDAPTVDGSKRGGEMFVMRDKKGRFKKVTNIFLFYDQFKINHAYGNFITCDVRFNIVSNLNRELAQLDVKLVWPEMTTTLSFDSVPPNTLLYYNYTLLGKGCYSMDKAPNIVVNRCRAKGMTSSECAKKILWLAK